MRLCIMPVVPGIVRVILQIGDSASSAEDVAVEEFESTGHTSFDIVLIKQSHAPLNVPGGVHCTKSQITRLDNFQGSDLHLVCQVSQSMGR